MPGALRERKAQLLELNLDINAIQKTCWTGFGKHSEKYLDIF